MTIRASTIPLWSDGMGLAEFDLSEGSNSPYFQIAAQVPTGLKLFISLDRFTFSYRLCLLKRKFLTAPLKSMADTPIGVAGQAREDHRRLGGAGDLDSEFLHAA